MASEPWTRIVVSVCLIQRKKTHKYSFNLRRKELFMMKELMMALAVLGLAGCTSVQLPADRLEHSEASIRGAEEVGASGVPAAAPRAKRPICSMLEYANIRFKSR